MARVYRMGPWRAESESGDPIPHAQATVWDAPDDGNQATNLETLDGGTIPGGVLECDAWGFVEVDGFRDLDEHQRLYIIGSEDGEIPGVSRVYLHPADTVERVRTLEDQHDDLSGRVDDLEEGDTGATLSGWHDVTGEDYGAGGDGDADDTSAIQSALDQVRDDGGGTVYLPPGTYSIDGTLRIYRDTRLRLAQGATVRRDAPGTMLINGDSDQDYEEYNGHGRILVEGGTWDANGVDVSDYSMVMSIGHAQNVTVQDCTILDVPGYHAIEYNAVKHGRIVNVACLGFVDDDGDRAFSEAIQLDLAKSSSVFGGFGPYDDTPCSDVEIRGCHIGASGTSGSDTWGRGIGSHSATATRWHRDIRVIGNHIEHTAEYAVGAYVWEASTISHNTVRDCGAGIWVRTLDSDRASHREDPDGNDTGESQHSTGLVISGNVITDCTGHEEAILLRGEETGLVRRATVTGNTIESVSGENGIRQHWAADCVISGNTVHDVGGTGISQQSVTGAVVHGNRVSDPGASGVSLDNRDLSSGTQADCVITGNVVTGTGDNGIHLLGPVGVTLDGNRIRNTSSYGFRITSSAEDVTITGNTMSGAGDDAVSITGTCDEIHLGANRIDPGEISDNSGSRWQDASLENGWENYDTSGDPWQEAQYRRDLDGAVHVRGVIDGGAAGDTAFTLPSGYRPSARLIVAGVSGTDPQLCRIQVTPDGEVIPHDDVDGFVTLDISFDAVE